MKRLVLPMVVWSSLAVGCAGPSDALPPQFEPLVPRNHRSEIESFRASGIQLSLVYRHFPQQRGRILEDYRTHLDVQGFVDVLACPHRKGAGLSLIQPPNREVIVNADDRRVVITSAKVSVVTIPPDSGCEFSEAASTACREISGTRCMLGTP